MDKISKQLFDILLLAKKNNDTLTEIKKKDSTETIINVNEYISSFFSYIFEKEKGIKKEVKKDEKIDDDNILEKTMEHNNINREYLIYVPSSYDKDKKTPLLFNFHGYGGSAMGHLRNADMRKVCEAQNVILVYPQGSLDRAGNPHWNSGLKSKDNKSDAEDFDFIDKLINKISEEYNINGKRIYACGFSNGGFFSYSLGCYLSEKIAGIGSVGGSMGIETYNECKPKHPMPMINIHSVRDNVVLYDTEEGTKKIADVINYWVEFNKTEKKALKETNANNTIERYEYKNGENNISVVHYKLLRGGHYWDDNLDYKGKNTSELICNYLLKYDMDGLIKVERLLKEDEKVKDDSVVCCMAMTKSCLSCQKGITEEEFCSENPGEYGCSPKKTDDIMYSINNCVKLLMIKLELFEEKDKLDELIVDKKLMDIDMFFINVMFLERWGMDRTMLTKMDLTLKEIDKWDIDDVMENWKIALKNSI